MLKINNLSVSSIDDQKKILKDFNIDINPNEIHAIMGPNGVGKSTLSKVIMGSNNYKIDNGSINFLGDEINDMPIYERARKGIFLCFQNPVEIDGVSSSEMVRTAINSKENNINLYQFIKMQEEVAGTLNISDEMLKRGVNVGLSGGERKKMEIYQLKMLKPKLIILDEIDSGLDIDSLKVIGNNVMDYYKNNSDVSILIITHYPRILDYIKPDYVHVMKDGKIVKTGDISLAYTLENTGYDDINIIESNDNNE